MSFYVNHSQVADWSNTILANLRNLVTGIGPLYLLVVICLWFVAYGIRLRRRERIPVEEYTIFAFSIFILLGYLTTAGWYRYLFEAQALLLLFLPNALLVVTQTIIPFFSPKKFVVVAVVVLTLAGAYQVMFSSFVAESYHRNKTAFLESYFNNASSTTSFFIYNVPEIGIFIRGANYYQYFNPAAGWYVGNEQLSVIAEGKVDQIIIGTDTYTNMNRDSFFLYKVATTTHDYDILEKI